MNEPLNIEVAGRPLRCHHCRAAVFALKTAAVDRLALGGMVHLEGVWGHQATVYACTACGFLHWFLPVDSVRHGRVEVEEAAEHVRCLSCGRPIPPGAAACPGCGWSWGSTEPPID